MADGSEKLYAVNLCHYMSVGWHLIDFVLAS